MFTDSINLTKANWKAWLPLVTPALGVLLLYYAASGRPASKKLIQLSTQRTGLQTAVEKLELRCEELNKTLQQHASEISNRTGNSAESDRILLIGTEVLSSPQTFGQLLDVFERHRLHCQQTEREEHTERGQPASTSYTFQLTGVFADVTAALQEVVETLPSVVPEQLYLRRESNGVCRWEIVCQLERASR